uniref:hypothetical protein n=1 Tax=Phascolarctobacterium succinatutens TaxID=626940 RepID=UPI0026F0E7E0
KKKMKEAIVSILNKKKKKLKALAQRLIRVLMNALTLVLAIHIFMLTRNQIRTLIKTDICHEVYGILTLAMTMTAWQ